MPLAVSKDGQYELTTGLSNDDYERLYD